MQRCVAVSLVVLGAVVVSSCSSSSVTSRTETRAIIEGRVVLAALDGLSDMSRVKVDIGNGEGGVAPGLDGTFRFSDIEPDLYTLVITYAGGLGNDAGGSAYKRYSTTLTAAARPVSKPGARSRAP